MTTTWLIALAGVLLLVPTALLFASNAKLKRQTLLIKLQSREIEKQIRELVHQNELSEQLIREKTQLIMLVSHDLKGPFNRIYALMQLLEMSASNLTDEQKEYLGKMYQIVGDGLNMVRNLVDVRKLEERGVDPHPETFNVVAVLSSIVNHYRIAAEKKTITINLDTPASIEFTTDRNYLSRIVENLLSNAVKFSPAGKSVHVGAETSEDGRLEISVTDEGPGINEEDQKQLYQRFHKLSARPTGGESSTGLGLSIVKQLVTSMGGDIFCTSAADAGCKFTVRMPALAPKPESSAKIQLNK